VNIGSFFVTLGLGGGKETEKGLNKVGNELTGISKKGFAAIATLAGVSYGFKVLYDNALRGGVGLTKFSSTTGLSTKELQKWQWAATQSGVAVEEVQANVEGLQQTMQQMKLSGFTPEASKFLNSVGADWTKVTDPYYLMKKSQEFFKTSKLPVEAQNQIMGSMFSRDMIGFLRNPRANPENAPGYAIRSDGTSNMLTTLNASMANLQRKVQSVFERILGEFGPGLIKSLNNAIPALTDLTKAVLGLTKYFLDAIPKAEKEVNTFKENWKAGDMLDLFLSPPDERAESIRNIQEMMKNQSNLIQFKRQQIMTDLGGDADGKVNLDLTQIFNIGSATRESAAAVGKKSEAGLIRAIPKTGAAMVVR